MFDVFFNKVSKFIDGVFNTDTNTIKMEVGNKTTDFTFHNASTMSGTGVAFTVGSHSKLIITISGTASSFTLLFKASLNNINSDLLGSKTVDGQLELASSTNEGGTWELDISGYEQVFFSITSIIGGNVTVRGRAVL